MTHLEDLMTRLDKILHETQPKSAKTNDTNEKEEDPFNTRKKEVADQIREVRAVQRF